MKYIILLLFIVPLSTFSNKGVVSVMVKSDIKIPDDFQIGIEEELTSYGYFLCQDNGCHNVYFQIRVDIIKKSPKVYRFNAKFLDLKNKRALSVKTLYFKSSISDYEKLMNFGKHLTKLIVKNIKHIEIKNKKDKNIKMKKKLKKKDSAKQNLSLSRMEKMLENQNNQDISKVKPIQNKNNTDLFYNSIITHPQIINIR
jgi:hypothetical protein